MLQRTLRALRSLHLPHYAVVLLAALLVGGGLVGTNVLTSSADARMPVQISPQAPSVASGEFLTYNAFVSCSIPEGCTNAVFTFSKPPGASGPGVVAQPYPPGVTGVVQLPNGDVQVTFSTIAVGSTKQLVVSWPTANAYTVPGPQPVTVTGTADTATSPSTATTTMNVTAAPNPVITKSGPATVAVDTNFTYGINISNTSATARGGLALDDLIVSDPLPAGLEFVSATAGATYDPVTRTVSWLPPDTNTAVPGRQYYGSSGFAITVRAPSTAVPPLAGTSFTNTATLTGTPLGGGDPVTRSASANTSVGVGPGTATPTITKTAAATVGDGQNLGYSIAVRNTGTAAGSALVTDTIPAGYDLRTLSGVPAGTLVTVTYDDGTSANFTYAGGNLAVSKVGAVATQVTLNIANINANSTVTASLIGVARTSALPPGSTALQNCATVVMSGTTLQSCATTTITAPQVGGTIAKTTSQAPVNPGGSHTWNVVVASTAAPLVPRIIDLLPPQLEYVPGSFAFVSTVSGTCPATGDYTVTTAANYQGGRDAILITGNDGVVLPGGTRCNYTFDTNVKPGAASGTYTGTGRNNIYLFDGQNQPFAGAVLDTTDIDHDGLTTDRYVAGGDNFAIAESSAADIVKQVRGDQDTDWFDSAEVPGQEDQVGSSAVGGTVDWRLKMGNQGNRNITDLVAYDLLPDPASPGVTDGRYDDTKPYEWVPTMTGPIATGGAPVTITYSTETDPCRPEMDATNGSAPFWCGGQVDSSFVPAGSVTDWSAIKSIRFDFGDHVFAGGDYFTFDWTMDVPTEDAEGNPIVDGIETWNKSAVQAARLNGDGTTLPLLPAEAPWVVDVIQIPKVPVVEIVKTDAAGNDANTADDAVSVPSGDTTDLEFTISNEGDENLVDVVVTDAVTAGSATVTGLTCDFSPLGGPSSGTTWAGPFEVGDSFTCTAELSELAHGVLHTDVATVTATGEESGQDVDDDDPYNAETPLEPSVDIEKTDAAGNDADLPAQAVSVPEGEETDLVFTITNDGEEPLVDVVVGDSVTSGEATVTGLSCDFSPLGGPATGTTWAGPFAVGDEFTCTADLSALTPGELHRDLATVTATGEETGTDVDDDDPYHAETPAEPGITIIKADRAGNDANTVDDAVEVRKGTTTDLEFTVENDGNEPLAFISVTDVVTDGAATVTGLSCDFSPLGGPASGTTWAGPFEVGDSFECTALLSTLTPGDPHADVATVTGTGLFSGNPVNDDDPYHAETPPIYAIGDYVWRDLDADGIQDADEPVVPGVAVALTDANGDPVLDADGNEVLPTTTDADGLYHFDNLPAGSYVVTFTAPAGYEFTRPLEGNDPKVDSDADVTTGKSAVVELGEDDPNLTDSVPSDGVEAPKIDRTIDAGIVVSGTPTVEIVKTDADGNDANTADAAVQVADGATTDLVFTVRNGGTEPLVDVEVTDVVTDGAATVTDLTCTFPDDSTGTTWDGPFAVDASFECTATLSALEPGDLHTDVATVTGEGQYSGNPVEDEDPFNAETPIPSVDIEKADAAGNDADTADESVTVADGATTDLVFTITNDGTEPLVDLTVADEVTEGDAEVAGLSCTFPDGSTGLTWAGPFAIDDSFECTATLSALTPGVDHADVASVDATGQYSGNPVDDNDPYHADTTAEPEITIVKEDAAGNDANTAEDAVTVAKGATTALVFTVTNSGNEALKDLVVTDEVTAGEGEVTGLTCDFSELGGPASGTTWAGFFEVGESFTCTGTLSSLTPDDLHTDEATVTGTGVYSGTPVDDDDPYNAEVAPIYAIGDYVWWDKDADGIQDQGEPVVEGVRVTLTNPDGSPVTDADGNVVEATTTDEDGYYHFDVLPAGSYVVTFTAPTGFEFTTALAGTDPKVDSDADVTTGRSAVIELGESDPNLTDSVASDGVEAPRIDRTIDAGIIVSGTPEVEIVKEDADGNDANTPEDAVTVPNDTTTELVFTITNSGTEPLVDIVVTDEVTEGSATVEDLSCTFPDDSTGTTWDGPFAVGASFECTATLSALAPGTDHIDVGTVSGKGQYSGTPTDDDDPYHSDTPPLVSVGDYVWYDIDRDGVQDENEPPVPGVVVNIYDAEGELVATTTTDEDGFYSFTDLKASTEYQIEFVRPTGSSFTTNGAGDDDGVDSNADLATGRTTVFTTPATGNNSATEPDDPTWDAGIVAIDLTITKTLDTEGPYQVGETVEFTLVPHNNGPVEALPGWSVTDVLPDGLTLVSISGEGYDCVARTVTCTDTTGEQLGVDADGAPITVTATIDADATGTLHNVTYITPADDDIPETNPLDVPTTDTDTDRSSTNNDDQASLELTPEEEPPGTTTTTPGDVIDDGDDQGPNIGNNGGDNGGNNGPLPRTGSDPFQMVAIGGLLSIAGLGLVLVTRRRRRSAA